MQCNAPKNFTMLQKGEIEKNSGVTNNNDGKERIVSSWAQNIATESGVFPENAKVFDGPTVLSEWKPDSTSREFEIPPITFQSLVFTSAAKNESSIRRSR